MRYRWYLGFLALIVSFLVIFLLLRSYHYLKVEEANSRREAVALMAEQFAQSIQADLIQENRRSFAEYRYLMVLKKEGKEELSPSPLSELPDVNDSKGLVGHFQIEPDGELRTPLLPEGRLSSLDVINREARLELKQRLSDILADRSFFRGGAVVQESWVDPEQNVTASLVGRRENFTVKQDVVFDVENNNYGSMGWTDSRNVEVLPLRAALRGDYWIAYRDVFRQDSRLVQGYVLKAPQYLGGLLAKLAKERFGVTGDRPLRLVLEDDRGRQIASWGEGERDLGWRLPLGGAGDNLRLGVKETPGGFPKGAEALLGIGILFLFVGGLGIFALARMVRLSREMSEQHADFISAVSHELKTPITAILMNCEMLQEGMVPEGERRQACYGRIAGESQRLSRLIQNILDLTQLERNRWRLRLERLNLDAVVRDVCLLHEPRMLPVGFQLNLALNTRNTELLLDQDALAQIVTNLLENALKFCGDAEIRQVDVSTGFAENFVFLRIRDYGPGVPPEDVKAVFELFYRVERELTRKTPGTGIGLSLVRHFCEQMNVDLIAQNAHPGFCVELRFKDTSF